MAELVRAVVKGKIVWVYRDQPADCPARHGRIGADWHQCPDDTCRKMCLQWACRETGCGYRLVDPTHEHVTAAPGVHRGG